MQNIKFVPDEKHIYPLRCSFIPNTHIRSNRIFNIENTNIRDIKHHFLLNKSAKHTIKYEFLFYL